MIWEKERKWVGRKEIPDRQKERREEIDRTIDRMIKDRG